MKPFSPPIHRRLTGVRERGAWRCDMKSLRSTLVALSLLALMPASSGAAAKPLEPLVVGSENVIQLQWQAVQHRGRPVLSGYIENDSLYGMTRVRLLVEAPAGTFFEVPAPPGPATSYRVRVFAFDRYEGGKG